MSEENKKILDKKEMSENQKVTFDDVSKKLNEFLKEYGHKKDLDGVDFIKGAEGTYESDEEKEIEEKLSKMQNIEEKLDLLKTFLDTFLDTIKKKELIKEFNNEKNEINKLKIEFSNFEKVEKPLIYINDINKKYSINNIFKNKFNDKYKLLKEKNKLKIEKLKYTNRDILSDITFQIITNDSSKELKGLNSKLIEKKDFFDNIVGKYNLELEGINKRSERIEEESKNITNYLGVIGPKVNDIHKKYSSLNGIVNNLENKLNIINTIDSSSLDEDTIKKIKEIKVELKKEIDSYKNEIKNYKKELKELKDYYNYYLGKIEENEEKIKIVNNEIKNGIKIKHNGKKINFNELLDNTQKDILKLAKEIDEKGSYEKSNKKVETDGETKYKIVQMIKEAEKMKKDCPVEYNKFINKIKELAGNDGKITGGDWNPLTTNELKLIKNKFKILENKFNEHKPKILSDIISNIKPKNDENTLLINAIKKYGDIKTIDINKLEKLKAIIEDFNDLGDKIKEEIGSDLERNSLYKNTRNDLIKFIKSSPNSNKSFDIISNKINNLLENFKTFTLNPLINSAEEEGNDARFRNKRLATLDEKDGTKEKSINNFNYIFNTLGEIESFINKNKYSETYIKLAKIIKKIRLDYPKGFSGKDFYKKFTQKKYGNITKKQLKEVFVIKNILDNIKNNINDKYYLNKYFKELEVKVEDSEILYKELKNKKEKVIKKFKNTEMYREKLYGKSYSTEFLKYLNTECSKINIKSDKNTINKIIKYFDSIEKMFSLYSDLNKIKTEDVSKKDRILILKSTIFGALYVIDDSKHINYSYDIISKEAIDLGLNSKEVDLEINNIEKKLLKVINKENTLFDDKGILKGLNSLQKLRKNNRFLYLKVLGQINIGKLNAKDIKNSLNLWNTIIGEEIEKNKNEKKDFFHKSYSIDFNDLSNQYLSRLASKEGNESLEPFKNEEAKEFINKTLKLNINIPIKTSYNENVANIYEKQALLMLNSIDKDEKNSYIFGASKEDVRNAKKLILFAKKENAFGDIRIINTLKALKGEDKKEETEKQIILEEKYTNPKTGKLNLYLGINETSVNILANDDKNSNLLKEISLYEFKENIMNQLRGGDIKSFINANPKATMSFFSYFIDNPKLLTLKEQLLFAGEYQKFMKELSSKNMYIKEAAGGKNIFLELKNSFGDDGQAKLMQQLENVFENVLKSKNVAELNKLGIENNEKMKKILLDMLEQMNYSEKEKKLLTKAIKEGKLSSEQLKDMKDNFDFMLKQKELILNIIGKYEKNDIERNAIFSEITEILEGENIPKTFSDKEKLKIIIKNLKEYIFKKFGDNIGPIIIKDSLNELINFIGKDQKSKVFVKIITNAQLNLSKEEKLLVLSSMKKDNNKELVYYAIGKGGKDFFNNIDDDSINSINFTEFDKKHQKSNKLLEEALNGNKEAQKEFTNKLEQDIRINQVETLVLVQKSNNIDEKYKNDFNNSVKSDQIIAQALEYSKKHPKNSISLRTSLKEYKKVLKTKDSLTIKEKKILSRLDYYDLEDPKMPIKILNNNKSEIEKQMNGKSGEVIISGKKYLATKNENGLLALLDKDNNQLVTMENNGFNETVKLTREELKTIGDSPEGISGFADFRRMFVELNIDNKENKIWKMRNIIFTQINQNGHSEFNISKNQYLTKQNQILFLNTLLKVTGKETISNGITNLEQTKTHFKKENFSSGGLNDKHDTNIYGDSEIGGIFIEKFMPRGNITGFNIVKFSEEIKK